MIEYADQLFVPEHVWENPRWTRLIDLGDMNIFLVNDVVSFEKEFKECSGDLKMMMNTVAIVAQLDGLSIEESFIKVSKMIDENEEEIFFIEKQFLNDPHCLEVTKIYIEHFNFELGGHYQSTFELDRYMKPDI